MDVWIFIIICAFTLLLAILGLVSGSIFALVGMVAGAICSLQLSIDNTLDVWNVFSGGWKTQTVSAYPFGYLLIFLTIINFVVIVKRMRGV